MELQPHEGSSETRTDCNARVDTRAGFNPTRVRLKLFFLDEEGVQVAASTPRGFV